MPKAVVPTQAKKRKHGSLDAHYKSCSPEGAERINMAIIKFIAYCALPFNILNMSAFMELLKELNPGFANGGHLVSDTTFRTTLLPKMYECTRAKATVFLQHSGENRFRTLGADGYETPAGVSMVNFGETIGKKTFYVKSNCLETQSSNTDYYTRTINDVLVSRAEEVGKPVDHVFAGFVGDNVNVNLATTDRLQEKYPRLFFAGCVSHILSLLCKDICASGEFKTILANVRFIVKFVRTHRRMKKLYLSLQRVTMLRLFSDTRFCGVALMVTSLTKNKGGVCALVDLEQFPNIAETIQPTENHPNPAIEFRNLVRDRSFWEKIQSAEKLLSLVAKACAYSETQGMRSPHIFPLMRALRKDLTKWAETTQVISLWTSASREVVAESVQNRCLGRGLRVGACRSCHVLAYVLNPYSTPTALEDGMREEAVVCFKTFFGENIDKPHLAENELDCLLERNGQLGRRVTSCQEWTSTLENPNPSDIDHLDLFRKHFNAEDDGVAFRIWNTVGRLECPHLIKYI